MPASHEDVNLCKVILSAGVLGYPTPRLLNWNHTFNDSGLVEGGSHIGKITGGLAFLESLDSSHDDDLVIMVDGYDIWFQLGPQVLLDRYHAINARANARLQEEFGRHVTRASISQSIVFSCQKRCWPWSLTDAPCSEVPQSDLPKDIYGPFTDMSTDERPYEYLRQRFLNSGDAIGPVGALRKVFRAADKQARNDSNFGSDQHIFSQMFGEQEKQRNVLKQRVNSWTSILSDWLPGVKSSAGLLDDPVMEFGIGVDYGAEMGLPTVFAEDDTEWLTFSDGAAVKQAQVSRNIPPSKGDLQLQADIAHGSRPFAIFDGSDQATSDLSWSNVSLLTNVYTGIVPAIIHHNAHRDGMKSRREDWWDRLWLQKQARALYAAQVAAPAGPVASSGRIQWWSETQRKGGVQADLEGSEIWLPYQDFCTGTESEIFRDDQGPLVR